MADKVAGGQLAVRLVALRADGLSHDRIAQRLYAEHGVEVTRQTVSNWLSLLDAETEPVAS